MSGIEDVEAVEEFYDFAIAELDFFEEISEDLESCDAGDEDEFEFDFSFLEDLQSDEDEAEDDAEDEAGDEDDAEYEDEDDADYEYEDEDDARRRLEKMFTRDPNPSLTLRDRLTVTIDIDNLVDDVDAKKMKKFSWKIDSASDNDMGLEILFSEPSLFNEENGEQFIVVKTFFSDFEPNWDNQAELLRVKIPK